MFPYYSFNICFTRFLFVFVLCSCQCAILRKKNISPAFLNIPYAQTSGIFFILYLVRIQRLPPSALPVHSSYGAVSFGTAYVYYHTPTPLVNCFPYLFLPFFFFFVLDFFPIEVYTISKESKIIFTYSEVLLW